MTDALDDRVTAALDALPGKERRRLLHAPFRASLDSLFDELGEHEVVRATSGAISASLGRGVLALTDERLVFCCTRSGAKSWPLSDVADVDIRRGAFTLPSALTLHLPSTRLVFALTGGRSAAAAFCEAVQSGLRRPADTRGAA
jgi:hypothetical protein